MHNRGAYPLNESGCYPTELFDQTEVHYGESIAGLTLSTFSDGNLRHNLGGHIIILSYWI
jgi:hypothetical protein